MRIRKARHEDGIKCMECKKPEGYWYVELAGFAFVFCRRCLTLTGQMIQRTTLD